MNARRRILLAVIVALTGLRAGAQSELIDPFLERYVRVKSAAAPGVLHLLYQRKADPTAPPVSCCRRYVPGPGWLSEERLRDHYRCVAFLRDALYIFREDGYTVLGAKDWRAERIARRTEIKGQEGDWRTWKWRPGWPPEVACRMEDKLWVFGVEAAPSPCVSFWFQIFTKLWVFGVEATPSGSALRVARVVPSATRDSEPQVDPLGSPLRVAAAVSDLYALARGTQAMVFWHQGAPEGEANTLWHATFNGSDWAAPQRVQLPHDYDNSDYAVAEHEGVVWMFYKARGRRLKAELPLQGMSLTNGKWGEPQPVPDALDSGWDRTIDIDAASFDGSLYVFRACKNRVVAHRWTKGRWSEPETLFQLSPWPTYLFYWSGANVLACLVLLPAVGAVALAVRGRARPIVQAFGREVRAASWPRRVAAQLVDILVAMGLCAAALQWLADGEEATRSEQLLSTLALCASIYFAYFALGEGLTGQSLGKGLLRIAVVGRDGKSPPLWSILVRNLLRPWPFLVPTAYLVGSLVLLLTPKSQRLGDILGRTVVVDLPPRPSRSYADDWGDEG